MKKLLVILSIIPVLAFVNGCSKLNKGKQCPAVITNMKGEYVGITSGTISNGKNSFSITISSGKMIDSGKLSESSEKYHQSSVTKYGFIAQRLTSTTFRLINLGSGEIITYLCPDD